MSDDTPDAPLSPEELDAVRGEDVAFDGDSLPLDETVDPFEWDDEDDDIDAVTADDVEVEVDGLEADEECQEVGFDE